MTLREPQATADTLSSSRLGEGTATERELSRQPDVWREAGRIVADRREALDAFLAPLLAAPDLRIVLTGAGSSAFVGEVAAPALSRRLHRRIEAVATTDLVSDPAGRLAEDVPTLLVSFARSGDSPESLAATETADRVLRDVHHLVITCAAEGRLARVHADRPRSFVLLTPERSNDEGFAMTSSFTSMLLSVLLVLLGDDEQVVGAVADAGAQVLDARARIEALAARAPERIVFLGSGPLAGIARESALKVLELTAGGIDTYFDSALGFRHGPKAVVDGATLVVVYASADPYTSRYDDDIARELRAAIGDDAVLTVRASGGGEADWVLRGLDGLDDGWLAVPFVLVGQLLALTASVNAGVPTDNPFPGGAVNRVVQGVTIHPLED
ncbi:SIS domain-containing protein [Amnibacterium kyonggiense]|uniref:Tagatose-6-phosphate ketose/aldose isomerase n=1 Tax=Amnibacterium kyonggiense TaxID=595671 RepID=A0A4V3EAL6_9MICO|nr:SIS domain-containing protein [Amnibacterium kyonggiense]TDS77134.1 tagatose-6-phosphate ketose/aldose isomerase [Amnibacterium kyonggiense]